MKKILILLLSVTITFCSLNAYSHGIWFAERSSELALIYGEGADDLNTVKRQHKVNSIKGYQQKWQPVDTKLVVSGPLLILDGQEKLSAVTAVLDNGIWSKTKEGKWYAKGRDAIPDALLSERTMKYAVHLRGELRHVPVIEEQKLQLQPVGENFSNVSGQDVTLKILYAGQPVAGAKVIGDFVNDPDAKPLLSDVNGMVTLPIRNQGLNVVAAVYDGPADDPNKVDKIEHLATLSFVLPHAEE